VPSLPAVCNPLERLPDAWPGNTFAGEKIELGTVLGTDKQAFIWREIELPTTVEA
jgi:hypothetical protein